MSSRPVWKWVAAAVLVAVVAVAVLLQRQVVALSMHADPHQTQFVGSADCQSCHVDRHDSWHATYHRTMTQEASATSVQGRFDGQALDYWGIRMRPIRADGRYYFEYSNLESGDLIHRAEVVRTVGSHRYQQYMSYVPEAAFMCTQRWSPLCHR